MNKKIRMIRTLFIAAMACQLSVGSASAQGPQKMSYQAVLRNSSDALVANTNVGMQVSILQGSAEGAAVYVERHFPKTNANGLVTTEIGAGTVVSGTFAAIDWSAGPYFIKTETDLNGGANYTVTGISQLLSVPYALYAQKAGTVELSTAQIESLKGERGLQGEQGPAGKDGAPGKDGADGLSAFELWKSLAGNETKTEAEFFVAVKGVDGKDGLTTSVNGIGHVNGAITLTKADIDLAQVDNTADIDKPISRVTQAALDAKVDKVTGKDLSTNDYTTVEKTKLAGIATGAEVNVNADWTAITGDAVILNKPTTLAGYGIGDAVNTSGNQTIGGIKSFTSPIQPIYLEVYALGTGDRNSFIDFHGDDTYTDYSLRMIRWNTGVNANSQILHRGTGVLSVTAQDAGSVAIQTNNTTRMVVNPTGSIDVKNNLINNVATPIATTDAVNKAYVDAAAATKADKATTLAGYGITDAVATTATATWDKDASNDVTTTGAQTIAGVKTFTNGIAANVTGNVKGSVNANNTLITNVATPVNPTDAATKAYVDILKAQIEILNEVNLNSGKNGTLSDIDGNIYKTIKIGNQVWMAENLKTTKYADGTPIPLVNTTSTWDALTATSKAYCWNNDDIANKATYGALYTWTAAMNGAASVTANPSGVQGVCPTGWHLPSDAEWTQMENYLADNGYNYDGTTGGGAKIGKSLASTSGWNITSTKGAVGNTDYPTYRNKSGFTALPGGYRYNSGKFYDIGVSGYWWSATKDDATVAWLRSIYYNSSVVYLSGNNKDNGYSVRCVRD